MTKMQEIVASTIESRIFTIRGKQVILDRDLAELYGVETKRLNQAVKRNLERFPEEFMFRLTKDEIAFLRSQFTISNCKFNRKYQEYNDLSINSVMSQIVTSPKTPIESMFSGQEGGTRKLPYVFTEQGVAMLSAVLRSKTAIHMSIQIMNAFVSMRHFLRTNARVFLEIDDIKKHLISSDIHQQQTDNRVRELFSLIDKYNVVDTQGIFYQGQIFDAYAKFTDFITQAKAEIILIDNYVDIKTLEHLSKKRSQVNVTIYTHIKTSLTTQDIKKFNSLFPRMTVRYTDAMHDRFLIIDRQTLYHMGASLKDLGRKCFAFTTLDSRLINDLLQYL